MYVYYFTSADCTVALTPEVLISLRYC